ncbi:Hpt domain-containing protein [Methylobacterium sp. J-078]|uniref:Hpt domain-containing protein n=1 Tax=Methylobacterium sp. J-078 TaxID=2836657 RepID=UPI001FBC065B|nr:Hpt domain-containing protein [Methylobacterium sp. J-078]MCJ2044304.1 Hpt domain-containing protein [Methylobacterium sp. J-078]
MLGKGDGAVLLDRAHLDRQTFGDAELARELLGLFAGQCRTLLPGIVGHDRPASERADLAHTLKGSALGVGATRIAQIAAGIEDALRAETLRAGAEGGAEEALVRAVTDTLAVLAAPV